MAGYKVNKLCKMLQAAFPDLNGMPLTWSPENVQVVKGAWRSMRSRFDVRVWHAYGTYIGSEGKPVHGKTVGSYTTITELIKFEKLYTFSAKDDEVGGYNGESPPTPHPYIDETEENDE